jgi:PAS domain-containing protein
LTSGKSPDPTSGIAGKKQAKAFDQTIDKQSQKALLNILDSIDATIYVADLETLEILYMNQSMKDVFGANFEGQICHKAFRQSDRPCDYCNNPNLLDEDGDPAGVVIWEGRNPINDRWYLNHDRAIVWMDGRKVRLQIATDITKIKQLEAERIRT